MVDVERASVKQHHVEIKIKKCNLKDKIIDNKFSP